jgi:hypothetical protein
MSIRIKIEGNFIIERILIDDFEKAIYKFYFKI